MGHFKKQKQAGFLGLRLMSSDLLPLDPASRVQPEPSWGAPLLKNQDQAWVLAWQRVGSQQD